MIAVCFLFSVSNIDMLGKRKSEFSQLARFRVQFEESMAACAKGLSVGQSLSHPASQPIYLFGQSVSQLVFYCMLSCSFFCFFISLQSVDVESIKKTLENGVCSNRAYSPAAVKGNRQFLKNKTKTENKLVKKSSVPKCKLLRCECRAKYHRHTHAFITQSTVMSSISAETC